jgi:outer membrane protein TolC
LYVKNAETYTQQIIVLQQLIDATSYQVDKGNISEKDLVRLQNDMLSLKTDERSNYENLLDAENDIKLLLKYHKNEFILPTLQDATDISDAIRNIGIVLAE